MKKKNIILLSCIILVAIVSVSVYYFTKDKKENTAVIPADAAHTAVEAKIDEYQSLTEIEDKVDIIVKAVKESEEDPIIQKDEMGNVNFTGTVGNVKITRLYTNKSGQTIEEGDVLPIFENEAYDAKTNTVYHVAGYTKMEQGQEYILFLTYSEGDQWYVPCSAVWGKYPLNPSEAVLYSNDTQNSTMESNMEKIGREVLDKYN